MCAESDRSGSEGLCWTYTEFVPDPAIAKHCLKPGGKGCKEEQDVRWRWRALLERELFQVHRGLGTGRSTRGEGSPWDVEACFIVHWTY